MKKLIGSEIYEQLDSLMASVAIENEIDPEKLKSGFAFRRIKNLGILIPDRQRDPRYFIVGATWGKDDMYREFISNSYWKMGYSDDDVSYFTERRNAIHKGDRIAIKKLCGGGDEYGKMVIRAIGIVEGIVDGIIIVNWIKKDIEKVVPHFGCVGTIYGPFRLRDERQYTPLVEKVFSI